MIKSESCGRAEINGRSRAQLIAPTDLGADASGPDNQPMTWRREKLAPWQARCIEAYIAANWGSRIRVMDLVRVVKFAPNRFDRVFKRFGNQSYLSNLFRKPMGQPPGEWRRINSMNA
jgi:hypothetical protein